ncbi:hypothetical protein BDC45DRAFT_532143 [Circinella umbellata]|nr:hypothetical protein BDC45DRAFT_532143 [Circinella umbellata]
MVAICQYTVTTLLILSVSMVVVLYLIQVLRRHLVVQRRLPTACLMFKMLYFEMSGEENYLVIECFMLNMLRGFMGLFMRLVSQDRDSNIDYYGIFEVENDRP